MIFKQAQQVLNGTKTQTRRPVKPGEYGVQVTAPNFFDRVSSRKHHVKWQEGKTYAVQPGRGKKAVGRIRITKIRRERLRDITWEDMRAEGVEKDLFDASLTWRTRFADLWDTLYRKPYRWEDDIEVWVLDFERVQA